MSLNNLSREELIERIDELESQVDSLMGSNKIDNVLLIQKAFGLSVLHARILIYLSNGQPRTYEGILNAVYFDRMEDPPEMQIIKISISKMRKKLDRFGIVIGTIWASGFNLVDPLGSIKKALAGEPIIDRFGVTVDDTKTRTLRPNGANKSQLLKFIKDRVDLLGVASFTSHEAADSIQAKQQITLLMDNLVSERAIKILGRPTKGGRRTKSWLVQVTKGAV